VVHKLWFNGRWADSQGGANAHRKSGHGRDNRPGSGWHRSIFTKNVGRAMRLCAGMEFSTVWVNDHIPLTSETPLAMREIELNFESKRHSSHRV